MNRIYNRIKFTLINYPAIIIKYFYRIVGLAISDKLEIYFYHRLVNLLDLKINTSGIIFDAETKAPASRTM